MIPNGLTIWNQYCTPIESDYYEGNIELVAQLNDEINNCNSVNVLLYVFIIHVQMKISWQKHAGDDT